MWVNPLFDQTHRASALELVRANPLATLIVEAPVRVSHVPVLLKETPEGGLELIGHMPRVDPASEGLIAGSKAITVFHGARSYVSPAWYVAPGLPTYNYLVAHLEGRPQVMADPEELRAHLLDLTVEQEAQHALGDQPWTPDQVANARMDELMPFILGFRIPVTGFQVKAKVGQNRPVADQRAAAGVLAASENSESRDIAQRMAASSEERNSNED